MVDNGSVTNAVIPDPRTLAPEAFSSVLTTPQRRFRASPRIDYQLSDKHSLFGRHMYSRIDGPSAFKFTPDNPLNAGNDVKARAHAFTAGSTYLLSTTTVNAFRLSFTRTDLLTQSPPYFDLQELGV